MVRNTARFAWLPLLLGATFLLPGCPGAKPAPISGYTPLGGVNVVVIVPQSMTVGTGTTQQFTATINNSNVAGVQWEVNGTPGGEGDVGTIDSSGNYTAPQYVPKNPHITISAVADAENTKSGSASVTIIGTPFPATVTISPKTAAVQVGKTLNLSATVTGPADTSVSWQVNGIDNGNATVGTIQTTGKDSAVYTAPASVPSPATVEIAAVSNSDPTKEAVAAVTISKAPPNLANVTISPSTATVQAGHTIQFTGSVTGISDSSILWEACGSLTCSSDDAGGNAQVGTVRNGLYSAPTKWPPAVNPVTVAAASEAQPSRFATATVTLTAPAINAVTISISPGSATVQVGGEALFKAIVGNSTDLSVTWQVNGVTGGNSTYGTVVPGQELDEVEYLAPATLPQNPDIVISAIPDADKTISATASVTITPPPKVSVTLSPTSVKVLIGKTQDFLATIVGAPNQGATWYVNNVLGGNSTTGTITNDGSNQATYTAPATAPSPAAVTIKAVSIPDPNAFGSATVTVVSSTVVEISPTTATIQETDLNGNCSSLCTVDFTAIVTGLQDPSLSWYANGELGGDPTINGTIQPTGDATATYTAPNTLPSSPVIVTAVASDGTVSNQAMVTVTPPKKTPPSISITPQNPPVPPGGTVSFSADVENNGGDNVVNWTLSGPAGGCVPEVCGTLNPLQTNGNPTTYSAPATIPPNPNVSITATADVSPHPQASTTITIAFSTATISISPANLTAVAGSGSSNPFTATVQNVDPNTTEVTWSLGCDSLAPGGENCIGNFLDPGNAGPGCITDGAQTTCTAEGSVRDLPAVSISYTPPDVLGSSFVANSCTQTAGTNGMVPLTASIAGTVPNCSPDGSSCVATICITVTPP